MDVVERPKDIVRRHPWEVARAHFLVHLVARLGLTETTSSWLDVGAGDAWLARQIRDVLPTTARLVCWDTNYTMEDLAPVGDDGAIAFTAQRPRERFDGVMMLDVIEHVEEDRRFVREVVDNSLSDSGWVLVTVPAYNALFSHHDRELHHWRRYSPHDLRVLLEAAGLTVELRGGLFHGLLVARMAQVARERVLGPPRRDSGIGRWQGGDTTTRALTRTLDWEGSLSLAMARTHLPHLPGLSTWAFCRRSDKGDR